MDHESTLSGMAIRFFRFLFRPPLPVMLQAIFFAEDRSHDIIHVPYDITRLSPMSVTTCFNNLSTHLAPSLKGVTRVTFYRQKAFS